METEQFQYLLLITIYQMGILMPVLETVKCSVHIWYYRLYLRVGIYSWNLIWGRVPPV